MIFLYALAYITIGIWFSMVTGEAAELDNNNLTTDQKISYVVNAIFWPFGVLFAGIYVATFFVWYGFFEQE